jgi:two-component system phosphate regulon sensor histidine kinase PhoR
VKGGTLGGRIFVPVAGVLAVLFAAGAVWGEGRIRAFHREEVERRLATAADLLEDAARAALEGRSTPEAVREQVGALRLGGPLRVTFIAADGSVLADSVARLPLENHAGRPEVLQAAHEGSGRESRFSASTGYPTLYYARRLDGPKGTLGFVRVSEPLERAEEEVRSLRDGLLVGGAAALLLALAVSALVARWVERPLKEIEAVAARLAGGELEVHAEVEGPLEVERLSASLNRMADQVRERMEAVRRVRADLESVLAGVVEGVVAVDGGERILFMNAAASRLLGLPAPVAPGGTLWEAVRFPDLEVALRAVLRGDEPGRRDAPSPAQDGRVLEIAVGPLGAAPPEERGRGAVAVLRDVTEVRRLERIRIDFVANVSHELRTPLSGVAGALETLEDEGLDPAARRRFLEIARRNADRLKDLVADLLDLSAIESEGTEIPLEPLPLDRPAQAAAAALADMASRCRVALSVEAAPPGLVVDGNARRLEQAFVNLVENALKFTPAGGRVTIRFLDLGAEAAAEVEDTGVGIPADALPRIFERFFRVEASRSRRMGGTGLGLAIVKHVAKAHRGRVEVRSTEGSGAVFRVVLPKAAPRGETGER